MGKFKKLVIFTAASVGVGYAVYKYVYIPWRKHEALVEVTEVLSLPATSTESFTDLSCPVEGTIRIKCSLLSRCTFRLALVSRGNGSGAPGTRSSSPTATFGRASFGSSVMATGGGTGAGGDRRHAGANWEDVETNMIVDPLVFEQIGQLQFTPALYGDYLLARYRAWPHDGYTVAASVKQCWIQPGGSPHTYTLSLDLHIHETVGEVVLSFMFPKGAKVLNVIRGCSPNSSSGSGNSVPVGQWRRYNAESSEYLWDVGNFTFTSGIVGAGPNPTDQAQELQATIGPGANLETVGHFSPEGEGEGSGATSNPPPPAPQESTEGIEEEEEEYDVVDPQPRHETSARVIPFVVQYYAPQPQPQGQLGGTDGQWSSTPPTASASGSGGTSSSLGPSASLRYEGRQGSSSQGPSSGTNTTGGEGSSGDIPMPSVALNYVTTCAASGIEVSRLKLIETDGVETEAVTLTNGETVSVRRKPSRAACHRTVHTQPIPVTAHM